MQFISVADVILVGADCLLQRFLSSQQCVVTRGRPSFTFALSQVGRKLSCRSLCFAFFVGSVLFHVPSVFRTPSMQHAGLLFEKPGYCVMFSDPSAVCAIVALYTGHAVVEESKKTILNQLTLTLKWNSATRKLRFNILFQHRMKPVHRLPASLVGTNTHDTGHPLPQLELVFCPLQGTAYIVLKGDALKWDTAKVSAIELAAIVTMAAFILILYTESLFTKMGKSEFWATLDQQLKSLGKYCQLLMNVASHWATDLNVILLTPLRDWASPMGGQRMPCH